MNIPFINQINENSCGAAVLEMIYKYYGVTNVSQNDIFEKYKQSEPHNSGNFRIKTADLISDAKDRGLYSGYYKIPDLTELSGIELFLKQILNDGVCIIVEQQYLEPRSLVGHFRVITDVGDNFISFHDPHPTTGGANLNWSTSKFLDYWTETGLNVTGGIMVLISNYDFNWKLNG